MPGFVPPQADSYPDGIIGPPCPPFPSGDLACDAGRLLVWGLFGAMWAAIILIAAFHYFGDWICSAFGPVEAWLVERAERTRLRRLHRAFGIKPNKARRQRAG